MRIPIILIICAIISATAVSAYEVTFSVDLTALAGDPVTIACARYGECEYDGFLQYRNETEAPITRQGGWFHCDRQLRIAYSPNVGAIPYCGTCAGSCNILTQSPSACIGYCRAVNILWSSDRNYVEEVFPLEQVSVRAASGATATVNIYNETDTQRMKGFLDQPTPPPNMPDLLASHAGEGELDFIAQEPVIVHIPKDENFGIGAIVKIGTPNLTVTKQFTIPHNEIVVLGYLDELVAEEIDNPRADYNYIRNHFLGGKIQFVYDPEVLVYFSGDTTKTESATTLAEVSACVDADRSGECDVNEYDYGACEGDMLLGACCDANIGCSAFGGSLCVETEAGWRWVTKPGQVVQATCENELNGTLIGPTSKCDAGEINDITITPPMSATYSGEETCSGDVQVSILDNIPSVGVSHRCTDSDCCGCYIERYWVYLTPSNITKNVCFNNIEDAHWLVGEESDTDTPPDAAGCKLLLGENWTDAGQILDRYHTEHGWTGANILEPDRFRNLRLCLKGEMAGAYLTTEQMCAPNAFEAMNFQEHYREVTDNNRRHWYSSKWKCDDQCRHGSERDPRERPTITDVAVDYKLCVIQKGTASLTPTGNDQVITSRTGPQHQLLCQQDNTVLECAGEDVPFLTYGNETGQLASHTGEARICSADGMWRTSLDMGDNPGISSETLELSCEKFGQGTRKGWSGTKCCGEPEEKPEYYTDADSAIDAKAKGTCYNSTLLEHGDLTPDSRIISYQGLLKACEPEAENPVDSPRDVLEIITNTCGDSLLEEATKAPNEHAACGPGGMWNFLYHEGDPAEADVQETYVAAGLWRQKAQDSQTMATGGCCAAEKCWNGTVCVEPGTKVIIEGSEGYRCGG